MRSSVFVCLLGFVICVSIVLVSQEATAEQLSARNALEGTWERVFPPTTQPDGKAKEGKSGQAGRRGLKLLTATHFSLISQRDGKFSHAHAGTYAIQGDTYIEQVEIASNPELVGIEGRFRFTIQGDVWHIDGMVGNTRYQETRKRVKAGEMAKAEF